MHFEKCSHEITMEPLNGLPFELVLPILATAVHLLKPRRPGDIGKLTHVLNVHSRSAAPELSYLVIMVTPWIDINHACDIGSIWLLSMLRDHLSCPPYSRPVSYSSTIALANATRQGHLHVLEWWSEHMNMRQVDASCYLALATKHERLDVMDWWVSGTVPGARFDRFDVHPINEAQTAQVLGWYLTRFLPELKSLAHGLWIGESLVHAIRELARDPHSEPWRAVVEWWLGPAAAQLPLPKAHYEEAMVAVIVHHGKQGSSHLPFTLDILGRLSALHASAWADDSPRNCAFRQVCPPVDSFATLACYSGDLELIQWCLDHLANKMYASWAYSFASAGGHLEVLHWLRLQGYRFSGFECVEGFWAGHGQVPDYLPRKMFHSCTKCGYGSRMGHYWAMWGDKKYSLNTVRSWLSRPLSPVEMACINGHVPVLNWWWQWDKSQFRSRPLVDNAHNVASLSGHGKCLEWFVTQKIHGPHSLQALYAATAGGHIHVLDWFLLEQPRTVQGFLTHVDPQAFSHSLVQILVVDLRAQITIQRRLTEWWYRLLMQRCGIATRSAFFEQMWASATQHLCLELLEYLWSAGVPQPTQLPADALNHRWPLVDKPWWMVNDTAACDITTKTRRSFQVLYWWLDHVPEALTCCNLMTCLPCRNGPLRSGDVLLFEEWLRLGLVPNGMTMNVAHLKAVAGFEWIAKYGRVKLDSRLRDARNCAWRLGVGEVIDWWFTSGLLVAD